jgi:hypothetical protein
MREAILPAFVYRWRHLTLTIANKCSRHLLVIGTMMLMGIDAQNAIILVDLRIEARQVGHIKYFRGRRVSCS